MMQNFERAKSRLNNIQAIEPLLSALRTLSMGSWQMALNKISAMKQYEENYRHILVEILPKIDFERVRKPSRKSKEPEIADKILLVIGTERGLCGKFNKILAENVFSWIESQNLTSYQIWVLGSKMIREFERMNIDIDWRCTLPASDLSTFQNAYLTTQNWLEQYENYAFNELIILFNQINKGDQYSFSTVPLLPYKISHSFSDEDNQIRKWPPPILETKPEDIYHQIIEQFIASSFYQMLLKSAAAEHAARFRLMEDAKGNAQEIIEDLQNIINTERKKKITQEVQELASGAGLIKT